MRAEDWIWAAFNLVIGFFLGVIAYGLAQVAAVGLWPVAALAAVVLLFVLAFEGVADWLFLRVLGRVAPRRRPAGTRRKPRPVLRRLGLPAGLALGALAAWTGIYQELSEAL